jgi:hypothetical protein
MIRSAKNLRNQHIRATFVEMKKKYFAWSEKLAYFSKASLASSVWRSVGEGSLQPNAASKSGNIRNLLKIIQTLLYNGGFGKARL